MVAKRKTKGKTEGEKLKMCLKKRFPGASSEDLDGAVDRIYDWDL